jgi:CHRD domain
MRSKVLVAVVSGFLATASVAKADQIAALLTGYEESPSVSTTARGEFTATIDLAGDTIRYTETYDALQAPVTQSHIHVGQPGVNGSIVIFLCQTANSPDPTGLAPQCPQDGTVSGTITAANVIAGATATQQLKAGDLAAVVTAIRAGAAYANVHTTVSPGGEIRGQIRIIAK